MEAVAARDDVAPQRLCPAVVYEVDRGCAAVDAVDRDVRHLEEERAAGVEALRDEVLDDLLLAVQRDRAAAGQVAQRDAVAAAAEAQLDAVVHHPLALEPLAHARLDAGSPPSPARVPGAHALLDVAAAARLEHDRLDPLAGEQEREQEPGGPGADDADLGPHAGAPTRPTMRSCAARHPTGSCAALTTRRITSDTVQPPLTSCASPSTQGPVDATR